MRRVLDYFRNIAGGYGSYILGWVTIVHALTGFILGEIDGSTAMEQIWAGLAVVLVRRGVENAVNTASDKQQKQLDKLL